MKKSSIFILITLVGGIAALIAIAVGISQFGSNSVSSQADMQVQTVSPAVNLTSPSLQFVNYTQPQSRMVIKTANLGFEVANYEETLTKIENIAVKHGGFVANSRTEFTNARVKTGNISLRIPSSKFDGLMSEVKKLAKELENENVSGNDITEEYYDLDARLVNKRKAETRFQEILKSAVSIKEIMEVEQSLANAREEIERMEGRKRYLTDQVSLSTINIQLHEPIPLMATVREGFGSKIGRGYDRGVEGFGEVSSALVMLSIGGSPLFAAFVLLLVLVRLYQRFRTTKLLPVPIQSNLYKK